jgi:hypothetical protein
MNGEPPSPPGDAAERQQTPARHDNRARPWTAAAAMEPLPPLAPPPARPGAGSPVTGSPWPPAPDSRLRPVLGLVMAALLVAGLVIVLLVVH